MPLFTSQKDLEAILTRYRIVALLTGGSAAYNPLKDGAAPRDWDGLILVKERGDIHQLLSNPHILIQILDLHQVECPDNPICAAGTSSFEQHFDAVRFCGRGSDMIKKSVKILSLDHIHRLVHSMVPNDIRILSQKDVRVYTGHHYGHASFRLQPVTRMNHAQLCILHDADIYCSSRSRSGFIRAVFGCTVDLLMTGNWTHVLDDEVLQLKAGFARKMSKFDDHLRRPEDPTQFFCRWDRFSIQFREDLLRSDVVEHLGTIQVEEVGPSTIPFMIYWNHSANPFPAPRCITFPGNIRTGTETILCEPSFSITSALSSPFSQNGTASLILIGGEKMFLKKPSDLSKELAGGLLSSAYGLTQRPVTIDKINEGVIYKYFEGITLADLRLRILKGEDTEASQPLLCTFLAVEMRRAEDFLAVYCSSVRADTSSSSIQQFYVERLSQNTRLNAFYGSTSILGIPWNSLMSLPIHLNGKHCGCLESISRKAEQVLSTEGIIVLGMGDSHSGNVMIDDPYHPASFLMMYVDYETAGWHSPWIDLAKPFYNDVFFEILYGDILYSNMVETGIIDFTVNESGIHLNLHISGLHELALSLWNIRQDMIQRPFERHCLTIGLSVAQGQEILGHALFCCALLSRNFTARPDVLFANIAVGVLAAIGGLESAMTNS